MEALRGSILSRSSHSGEGFKAQRKEMIEKWLDKYEIKNYTIKDDFTIDVDGNVYLSAIDLKEFSEYIQFGVVRGDFVCRINYLTSLRGVPRIVGGCFDCSNNQLTSLKGSPEKVGRDFYCRSNKLTSLEGAPKEIGGYFDCGSNQLTSLEGAPKEVGGYFSCDNNKLTSLKRAPKEVGRDFYCSNNKVQFTKKDVERICDVKEMIFP